MNIIIVRFVWFHHLLCHHFTLVTNLLPSRLNNMTVYALDGMISYLGHEMEGYPGKM
jgi:hypothetical protein